MFCSKCGSENNDRVKFCKDCGQSMGVVAEATVPQQQGPVVTGGKPPTNDEPHLGVRNREGVFTAPNGGGMGAVAIVLIFFLVIAVIGILASVVLASLNSARDKGADVSVKVTLSSLNAQAELYYDSNSNSYSGFCNSSGTETLTSSIPETRKQNYTCNDSAQGFAVSLPLSNGKYYCADSTGAGIEVETAIGVKNSCSGNLLEKVSWEEYTSSVDGFSINFPVKPTVETKAVAPTVSSPMGYTYRTYTASDGQSSFFVFKNYFSDTIDVSDPETLLKQRVLYLSDSGQLLSSSYRKQGMYPEVEFLVKIDEEMMKGKDVLVGQTVFSIIYDYFPSSYNETDYEMFVNSFKVN